MNPLSMFLYLVILFCRHKTVVSGVEGDIFSLAKELRRYLIDLHDKSHIILLTVSEPQQKIYIDNDFVNDVKEFLFEKGFLH